MLLSITQVYVAFHFYFINKGSILFWHYRGAKEVCHIKNKYSRDKNKRIKKLKIDLIWEISLANCNKYANTICPLETISIDYAPLPNFKRVI